MIHSSAAKNGTTTMLTEHMYDRQNRIKEQTYQLRNSDDTFKTYALKYSYRGSDGSLVKVESADGYIDAYSLTYDDIARLSTRTNSFFTQTYDYRTEGSETTTQVESLDYAAGTYATDFEEFTLTYGYDKLGNISTITSSANTADNRTYTYDVQGQMLTEKIGSQTNSYTYDSYGNIRTAVENGTTHTYTYGDSDWKDLLTAYDGQSISYDEIGNPTSYYNGTRWTFDWEKGRQLTSASGNGKTVSYTYDMAGVRDGKTVDGVTYNYLTLDGKVVRQTWTENGTEHVLDIIYDASGQPYGCVYDGTRLYYVLNQQGDVVRIVGYLGKTCAEYRYDAWGNVIEISGLYKNTIGKINPIRYRGYYYDAETGFYYLQSRYYDPSIGRFINADDAAYLGVDGTHISYNLFVYCGNNPVMGFDPAGTWDWGGVIAGLGIVAGTVLAVVTCGIATPLGAVVASAAITTGVTTTYAAATDSAMVVDLSYSVPFPSNHYIKIGASVVIDFKDDNANLYPHLGLGKGHSEGLSYSTGMVENYDDPKDYAEHFVDVNIGKNWGLDHCWNPLKPHGEATKATSLTFSLGSSYGAGYDYYFAPIQIFAW